MIENVFTPSSLIRGGGGGGVRAREPGIICLMFLKFGIVLFYIYYCGNIVLESSPNLRPALKQATVSQKKHTRALSEQTQVPPRM